MGQYWSQGSQTGPVGLGRLVSPRKHWSFRVWRYALLMTGIGSLTKYGLDAKHAGFYRCGQREIDG